MRIGRGSVNQAALYILGYGSVDEIMADGFDMVAASVVEEDREELLECIRGLKYHRAATCKS